MQDMQDMMRRLNQSGKRLSKGHRKIAEYIVEHYDKAVFMTASKLGEKVGVFALPRRWGMRDIRSCSGRFRSSCATG